jgi:hypothetical protein
MADGRPWGIPYSNRQNQQRPWKKHPQATRVAWASSWQVGHENRTRRGTDLRSHTTRLPPSKQMKQTTSSSFSLLLAGFAGGATSGDPSPFFGGLPLFFGTTRGAVTSAPCCSAGPWRADSPMMEPRNCESSIPGGGGGGAGRRSSGGQSASAGGKSWAPAGPSSMDRPMRV